MKYRFTYERCFLGDSKEVKWIKETSIHGIDAILYILRLCRWSQGKYGNDLKLIRKSKGVWVEVANVERSLTGIYRTITIEPIKEG